MMKRPVSVPLHHEDADIGHAGLALKMVLKEKSAKAKKGEANMINMINRMIIIGHHGGDIVLVVLKARDPQKLKEDKRLQKRNLLIMENRMPLAMRLLRQRHDYSFTLVTDPSSWTTCPSKIV